MKIGFKFITIVIGTLFLFGCGNQKVDESKYSIEEAINNGDVVIEFFEKTSESVKNSNFKVENANKLHDFKLGEIDSLSITYYTKDGAYERSDIKRNGNEIIFDKTGSIYRTSGTYTCNDFAFGGMGFSLTDCESDSKNSSWEVNVLPLTMTMLRENKLLN